MYVVDNKRIGAYLKRLIEKKYPSHRQFCKYYLEKIGIEPSDEEIRKMSNRVSSILKGIKGIQITDLPVVTDLLGVSCEEILSAGKCFVKTSNHITNYDVAYSKNPSVWKKYVERGDKLILNCDEYGKTIIDYIFEFKNYKLLKYLMDEKVIWLVDNSGWDGMTYGAGTSIQRRKIGDIDTSMPLQIRYEDQIRTKALALAIENKDTEMLDVLLARENPGLHNLYSLLRGFDSEKYYNEDLVYAVANADKSVQEYFLQEFIVEDLQGHKNKYIFPYIGRVIDVMLQNDIEGVEFLIREAIAHNKYVYQTLLKMGDDAYKVLLESFNFGIDEAMKEEMKERAFHDFAISEGQDMVSLFYSRGKKKTEFFASNIVYITKKSNDRMISKLIQDTNAWKEKIINLRGASNE